jgi:UDP-N-acetylmuramoyl-tripeptide--D-alanyl-D-alanine ligase
MMRAAVLSELAQAVAGQVIGADVKCSGVSTDTRTLAPGDLFVALPGDNFDGHNYLDTARQLGAAAALVQRPVDVALPQLQVADTQQGLGYIGGWNRDQFSAPLIAITGSSGKTTVKNMVNAVLSQRGKTLATEGNFNNEIGVPLTLLRLTPEYQYAVVEMGAAAQGDIRWLCEIGKPTVSILLNAMPAHLQGFGSVEGVAQAKGEIFDGLDEQGIAIINADQTFAEQWRQRATPARILDFGLHTAAAVTATDIESLGIAGSRFRAITPVGEMTMTIAIGGVHNVANALAAVCAGLACELSLAEIAAGLATVAATPGRLSVRQAQGGATVIDDCYNANPGSVRAALTLLADCGGRRIAVLGTMKELGDDSELLHREVGEFAAQCGIDVLWGVGDELRATVAGFGQGGRHFGDMDELRAALGEIDEDGNQVLVKGSRGAGMERVVSTLCSTDNEAEG